jgi:peptide/nickel transport system substrate-binding protein
MKFGLGKWAGGAGLALLMSGLLSTGVAFAAPTGTIVVGINADLAVPDPYFANGQKDANLIPHLYESLVTTGEKMGPVLQLAESYTVSDDGLTYTFVLRQGVRFHDGGTMTSEDVLSSWKRYQSIGLAKDRLAAVETMSAPDANTFVVTLKRAVPSFIETMASPQFPIAILPKADGDKAEGDISFVGTGPFKLVEQVHDDHTTIEYFPDYSSDKREAGTDGYAGNRVAEVERVIFKIIPDAGTRLTGLQTGQLQIADNLTVAGANRLVSEGGVVAADVMPFGKMALVMNSGLAPTNNLPMRRAIQAALNAGDIMEVALDGFYSPSPSFVFNFLDYYPGDAVDAFYSKNDLDLARQLLAEAGYAGEKIILQSNTNLVFLMNASLVIAEQLKAAGINVEVQTVDWPTNLQNLMNGEGGWNLTPISYASQPGAGPWQWVSTFKQQSHFESDPVYDQLVADIQGEADPEARYALWKKIEVHMGEQAYMVMLGDRGMKIATDKKMVGFSPFYSMRFWNVSLSE